MVNSPVMSTSPHRAQSDPHYGQDGMLLDVKATRSQAEPAFDRDEWSETPRAHGDASEGGRTVLGWALVDPGAAVDWLYRLVGGPGPGRPSR